MPADQTAAADGLNDVLATLTLSTSSKEYLLTGGMHGREVTFYCDVAWKYSDKTAGTFLDVPAHPAGFAVIKIGPTSVFAKVASGSGTLTPVVSG